MRIQELLRQNRVPFQVLELPAGMPLGCLADEGKARSDELAQVALLRADHGYRYLLAVAPLDRPLELRFAMRALEGCDLKLAGKDEHCRFCPDDEGGLMPFGSHYNVRTLFDQSLADEEWIVFAEVAGSQAIRMKTADYSDIEHPFVVPLTLEAFVVAGR